MIDRANIDEYIALLRAESWAYLSFTERSDIDVQRPAMSLSDRSIVTNLLIYDISRNDKPLFVVCLRAVSATDEGYRIANGVPCLITSPDCTTKHGSLPVLLLLLDETGNNLFWKWLVQPEKDGTLQKKSDDRLQAWSHQARDFVIEAAKEWKATRRTAARKRIVARTNRGRVNQMKISA